MSQAAVNAGALTLGDAQAYDQQQLTNQQIAAQKAIADQQNAFNQQQLAWEQQQAAQQQQQVQEQADRQTAYDTGRTQQLNTATQQINQAFQQFSPDYFSKFASDYMGKVQDQVDYQRQQADKQMAFGLARAGTIDSQARANQTGLLDEAQGRTLADATTQAQNAANTLQGNVTNAKANLLGQVQAVQGTSSPIAAGTIGGVDTNLQTQQNQISGIVNNAGDVTASLNAVPTVGTLGNIFAGMLGSAGSYLGGLQANAANAAYKNAYAGTGGGSPFGSN